MLLIALERYILVTSWQFHRKRLTVRRQVGLSVVFFVYFLFFATILTLLTDSEVKYGVLVTTSKHKVVSYALFVPNYTLVTFTSSVLLPKHFEVLVEKEKNTCLKSKQLKSAGFPEGEKNNGSDCYNSDIISSWYFASFSVLLADTTQYKILEPRTFRIFAVNLVCNNPG